MRQSDLMIKENYPLSGLTTFEAGGAARYYIAVSSEDEVASALEFAGENDQRVFVLGGGSNLLISDEGFPGLVIHNRIRGFDARSDGRHVIVSAGAGEDWQVFADRCVALGLQGLECLAGIPGTVGASPTQNIGAYGQDVSETVAGVRAIKRNSGIPVYLTRDECRFGYRRSLFNTDAAGDYIITSVDFRLVQNGHPGIRYRELERQLGNDPDITLAKVRDAVIGIRGAKGLLVGEGVESFKSAGSFFRNPVVPVAAFRDLETRVALAGGCSEWAWPMENGMIKISAACLIERAGFTKGHRSGNVGISPRHTLIIINYGGATAAEIVSFATSVQDRVFAEFGVSLVPEVRLVGFPDNSLRG
jgi:UDP-N-acetylmuramate dehydrogenase